MQWPFYFSALIHNNLTEEMINPMKSLCLRSSSAETKATENVLRFP